MTMLPLTICEECFSPLEVFVDLDGGASEAVDARVDFRGSHEHVALEHCCRAGRYAPVTPAGWTPLLQAPRLGARIGAKNL